MPPVTLADITAEYERSLKVEQPARAKATVAQMRAMRAIERGLPVYIALIPIRTMRSLLANQWIEEIRPNAVLTPAGRAALERY